MPVDLAATAPSRFDIKSAQLPLVSLRVKSGRLDQVAEELAAQYADVPDFFDNDPLLIDFAQWPTDVEGEPTPMEFEALLQAVAAGPRSTADGINLVQSLQTARSALVQARAGVDQVLASRPIATPLHLLDCCPISDGAVALVVGADDGPVRISGAGQAHRHQHLSALRDILDTGAARALGHAYADAGIDQDQVDYLGIYDSFTITLAMLLEELGFAPRGGAADRARRGDFDAAGPLPLNTHGGLLSFGHSGVAGGMAHVAEAWTQLAGRAGSRQAGAPRCALVHADGGVLSAHVSLVLQAEAGR